MRLVASLLAFSVCGALAGCSSGKPAVLSGTVSFKGKNLAIGTVTVVSDRGDVASAEIQADGTYTIPDAPRGVLKVSVISPNPKVTEQNNKQLYDAARGKTGPPPAISLGDPTKWFEIPQAYGDPDQSGLSVEVRSGENKYDIVMQ